MKATPYPKKKSNTCLKNFPTRIIQKSINIQQVWVYTMQKILLSSITEKFMQNAPTTANSHLGSDLKQQKRILSKYTKNKKDNILIIVLF